MILGLFSRGNFDMRVIFYFAMASSGKARLLSEFGACLYATSKQQQFAPRTRSPINATCCLFTSIEIIVYVAVMSACRIICGNMKCRNVIAKVKGNQGQHSNCARIQKIF